MKFTKNQERILSELKQTSKEITAQDLYQNLREKGTNIGLATIYRTLKKLHLEGFIQERITLSGESLYILIKEKTSHFHHLNCLNCGETININTCPINEQLNRWCESQNFTVYYHTLEFFGLCNDCQLNSELNN